MLEEKEKVERFFNFLTSCSFSNIIFQLPVQFQAAFEEQSAGLRSIHSLEYLSSQTVFPNTLLIIVLTHVRILLIGYFLAAFLADDRDIIRNTMQ